MEKFTVGFGNSYWQLDFEMVLGTAEIPPRIGIPLLIVLGDL